MKISPTGKGQITIGCKQIKIAQQRDRDLVYDIERRQEGRRRQDGEQAEIDHNRNRDLTDYISSHLDSVNPATYEVIIGRVCAENGWQCTTVPGSDMWILLQPGAKLRDAIFIQGARQVLETLSNEYGMYIGG